MTLMHILARVASEELAAEQQRSAETMAHSMMKIADPAMTKTSSSAPLVPSPVQDNDISPTQYLEELFARYGINLTRRQCHGRRSITSLPKQCSGTQHPQQGSSIPEPSFEDVDAYDMETATAVRTGNLVKLKQLYHDKGYSLSACNRFGESLLHISCRRGHAAMVRFMTQECKVNPRVMDDMGRSAFHDVCWSSVPNLDTMDVLLEVGLPPIGLLMQDARGHTPFDYAPRKHWGIWLQYLQQRQGIFVNWILARKERAVTMRRQQLLQQQVQPRMMRNIINNNNNNERCASKAVNGRPVERSLATNPRMVSPTQPVQA
jgi:Ankyrin repeats (many copies)